MLQINNKCSKGERVDPKVVLLLSGVIQILAQHDTIVEVETRTLKPSRQKMPHLKSKWLQLRHPKNSHHKKQSGPSNQRNVVCAVKLLKEIATIKTI